MGELIPGEVIERKIFMIRGHAVATRVNIAIMCAFVKLRQILSMNRELAHKLA